MLGATSRTSRRTFRIARARPISHGREPTRDPTPLVNDDDSSPTSTDTAPDAARRLPPWKEGLAAVGPTAAVGVLAPTVAIALGGSGWERPTAHTMALVHAPLRFLGGACARRAPCEAGPARLADRVGDAPVRALQRRGGWRPCWGTTRSAALRIPAFIVANLLVVGASVLPSSRRRISRTRRLDVAIMVSAPPASCGRCRSRPVQRAAADRHDTAVFATLAVVKVASVLVAMDVLAQCRPDEHHDAPVRDPLILLGVADLIFAPVDNSSYLMFCGADTSTTAARPLGARGGGSPGPPVAVDLAPLLTVAGTARDGESSWRSSHSRCTASSTLLGHRARHLGAVMVLLAIIRLGQLEQEQRRLSRRCASARRLHDQARVDADRLGNRLRRRAAPGDLRPQRRPHRGPRRSCMRRGRPVHRRGPLQALQRRARPPRRRPGAGPDGVPSARGARGRGAPGRGRRVRRGGRGRRPRGRRPARPERRLGRPRAVRRGRPGAQLHGQRGARTPGRGRGRGRRRRPGEPAGGDAGVASRRTSSAAHLALYRRRSAGATSGPSTTRRFSTVPTRGCGLQQNLHEALAQDASRCSTSRWWSSRHAAVAARPLLAGTLRPWRAAPGPRSSTRSPRAACCRSSTPTCSATSPAAHRDSGLRWVAVAMSRPEIAPGFTVPARRAARRGPALIRIAVPRRP